MSGSLYGAGAEYALHSLLILAARSEPASVRDLAGYQKLPERFLAKLFTRLKKAGLVDGLEGIRGGYTLARSPERISVMDIVEAIDPDRSLFECGEIRRRCELFDHEPPAWSVAGPCRIHQVLLEADRAMRIQLASKSLSELGAEFEAKAPQEFLSDAERWFRQRREERIDSRPGP